METAIHQFVKEHPFKHTVPIMDDMVVGVIITDDGELATTATDAGADYGAEPACCFHHVTARLVHSAFQLLRLAGSGDQGWEFLKAIMAYRELAQPSMDLDAITPAEGLN